MKLNKTLLVGGVDSLNIGTDIGLTATRIFFGAAMAFAHGIHKVPPSEGFVGFVGKIGFPAPELFAWGAGVTELVGGILLALGLMTRPAAFFLLLTMVVAAFGAHGADPFKEKELAFAYLFGFLPFIFLGGGKLSIDRFLRK